MVKRRKVIHQLLAALVVVSGTAIVAASPADGDLQSCPAGGQAELFATNNTAVITDAQDARLRDPLQPFDDQVDEIILRNGASAPASTVLNGVFWSDERHRMTYERSRVFHICDVDALELHSAADEVRARFGQESVLTFEYLAPNVLGANAVQITAPGVDVTRVRDAFTNYPVARQRLRGASVTDEHTLILVADDADLALACRLVIESGGSLDAATVDHGRRDFVE